MGIVFDIQRCCYHDGPGIRTTVFLKGCNLRCAWCHNPESFSGRPQLKYTARNCVGCQACARVCPQGVHSFGEDGHRVDFARCIACGACARVCPQEALSIVGQEMSAREVLSIVARDRAFYDTTGGGMTVSGGEPTFQSEFLLSLLQGAKELGTSTALETNGYIAPQVLDRVAPLTDLFLLDFKLTVPEGLARETGAQGDGWERTMEVLTQMEKPVILRMPVIPGINDTEEHFRQAVRIRQAHPNVQKLEIMAYHSIGAEKWAELGLQYTLGDLDTVPPDQAKAWNDRLAELQNAPGR